MQSNVRPDSMERITTKEPTDDMIECAITSFKAVLPEDAWEEDKDDL